MICVKQFLLLALEERSSQSNNGDKTFTEIIMMDIKMHKERTNKELWNSREGYWKGTENLIFIGWILKNRKKLNMWWLSRFTDFL